MPRGQLGEQRVKHAREAEQQPLAIVFGEIERLAALYRFKERCRIERVPTFAARETMQFAGLNAEAPANTGGGQIDKRAQRSDPEFEQRVAQPRIGDDPLDRNLP